jgi:hypothetical protein
MIDGNAVAANGDAESGSQLSHRLPDAAARADPPFVALAKLC